MVFLDISCRPDCFEYAPDKHFGVCIRFELGMPRGRGGSGKRACGISGAEATCILLRKPTWRPPERADVTVTDLSGNFSPRLLRLRTRSSLNLDAMGRPRKTDEEKREISRRGPQQPGCGCNGAGSDFGKHRRATTRMQRVLLPIQRRLLHSPQFVRHAGRRRHGRRGGTKSGSGRSCHQ